MRKSTAIITATATALAGIGIGVAATVALTPAPTVNTCSHEDSTSCYWDANTQGNGEGESFYTDANGTTYYAHNPHCDDMATRVLDMASMLASAWENGTAYDDSFRVDNIDVYAEQLAACN